MLLCTNLINDIRIVFCVVKRWNLFPITYPYLLKVPMRNSLSFQVLVHEKFANYNWILQELLFLLLTIFGILRIFYDCPTIFHKVTVLFFVYFGIEWMILTRFQKTTCYQLSLFLNQLMSFEIHNVGFDNWKTEQNFWKKDVSTQVVSAVSKIFTFALVNHSFCYSLSCAVFPNVSWNIIPSFVMKSIPELNFATVLVKRVTIWYYLYVSMRLFTNLPAINVMVNLLIPTFCLGSALRFLQR